MTRLRSLPLLLAAACAAPASAPELAPVGVADGRYVMGTVLEITLPGASEERGRVLLDRLFARAAALDQLFSTYDPDSDLVVLNRHAGQGLQPVAPELAAILAAAQDYGALTHGVFDVTVGPLVELWTEAARRDRAPDADEIEAALGRVGAQRMRVTDARAELPIRGMSVDLGGLAKGWALDRMRELLATESVANAFVSFGQSSILGLGTPPDAPGWRVLLRGVDRPYAGVVTLHDRALSVSASVGQWSEIGGRRYGHVLDPRTGHPLTRRREAAVLDASAARAEALSTALLVLDVDAGLALLESLDGAEGMLMEEGRMVRSSGWAGAVDWAPLD